MMAQMFAFAINLASGFLLTPYIIRKLGKEAYGFFGLALNIVGYSQLVTIAINSMAYRFITISYHKNDFRLANLYFTSVFYSNIFISIILCFGYLVFFFHLQSLLVIPVKLDFDVKCLFVFIFINFIVSLITSVFGVATFVKNRLDLASAKSINSSIIKFLIILISYYFFSPKVWYLGFASLMSSLYLFYSVYSLKNILAPKLVINKIFFKLEKVIELLKSGIWNVLNKLSAILNVGLDLLLANIFISPSAMGNLYVSKTIPGIILSVFATMSSVYAPKMATLFARNKSLLISKQLVGSIKFFAFLSSIVISLLFAYGDVFYKLWLPDLDNNLIYYLSILTCVELCFALPQESMWNVFTITNQVKKSSINLLVFSLMNITTVLFAIQIVEIDERVYYLAGITSGFSIIRLLTFLPTYSAKLLNLKLSTFYPTLLLNVLSTFILTFVSLSVKWFYKVDSWLSLILISLFSIVVGVLLNWFLILNLSDRKIVRNRINYFIKFFLRKYLYQNFNSF